MLQTIHIPVKTKVNQLRALDGLIEYAKGRADFAQDEEEHLTACKVHTRLDDIRKLFVTLPEEKPENVDTL